MTWQELCYGLAVFLALSTAFQWWADRADRRGGWWK